MSLLLRSLEVDLSDVDSELTEQITAMPAMGITSLTLKSLGGFLQKLLKGSIAEGRFLLKTFFDNISALT